MYLGYFPFPVTVHDGYSRFQALLTTTSDTVALSGTE